MAQAEKAAHGRRNALWFFAAASLATIAIGSAVMVMTDIPVGIAIRNPIAWLVAGGLTLFTVQRGWLGGWAVPAAPIVVALSFLGAGQEDVHRWLDLGAVQLNAAALVLPMAIASFKRARALLAVASFAGIAVLLALQPDISQLAGFIAAVVVLAFARFGWRGLALAALMAAAAVALCLSRTDPLEPVAHVEGIFVLAWSQSPALAMSGGIALAAAALAPLLMYRANPAATALAAYFAITALTPAFGAYPVPLAGYGFSFVIGWWLAMGALTGPAARSQKPTLTNTTRTIP